MSEVFVDTSGWVALKHRGDTFWRAATALNRSLLTSGYNYVTTNFVLDESYTLLRLRAGHHVAVELGEEIAISPLVTVVPISPELEKKPGKCLNDMRTKCLATQIAHRLSLCDIAVFGKRLPMITTLSRLGISGS